MPTLAVLCRGLPQVRARKRPQGMAILPSPTCSEEGRMENVLGTIARGVLKTLTGRRTMVCAACGRQGPLARHAAHGAACAACGSHLLVSPDSPIGRGLRARHAKN